MTTEQLELVGLTLEEFNALGPIEKLYLDVSQRLKAVEQLRWTELECGQLEIPQETYPVQFPCVLIDFPEAPFEDELHGNQMARLLVQLRVGIDLYEDLHIVDGREAPDMGTAVKRLGLITEIHKVVHRFETEYSTKLMRVGISMERRDDGIKVIALMYACAAKDDSACDVLEEKDDFDFTVQRSQD